MSNSYIGEIRIFAGNFAPVGWHICNGDELSIGEHPLLFDLIRTTYGGDGVETFCVPDMRGRIPVHQGPLGEGTFLLGEKAGVERVTLSLDQMPAHTHRLSGSKSVADQADPSDALLALSSQVSVFMGDQPGNQNNMNIQTLSGEGISGSHSNMQPFLCLNFIISLYGSWPNEN